MKSSSLARVLGESFLVTLLALILVIPHAARADTTTAVDDQDGNGTAKIDTNYNHYFPSDTINSYTIWAYKDAPDGTQVFSDDGAQQSYGSVYGNGNDPFGVDLSWDAVSGADGYVIQADDRGGGLFWQDVGKVTSYTDNGLSNSGAFTPAQTSPYAIYSGSGNGNSGTEVTAILDGSTQGPAGSNGTFSSSGLKDWQFSVSLPLSSAETVQSITVYHPNGYDTWSTSNSNNWPVVVFLNGSQQNAYYGQTFALSSGNTSLILYADIDDPASPVGGTIKVSFTDGSSLSVAISGGSQSGGTTGGTTGNGGTPTLTVALNGSTSGPAGHNNAFTGNSQNNWQFSANLSLPNASTIQSIDIYHSDNHDVWSTSNSNNWPVVVFLNGSQQNAYYGQTFALSSGNTSLILYADIDDPASPVGGSIKVSFIDGTSLSAAIPGGGGSQALTGWAWSSNIGWLSVNSSNSQISSYGGAAYKVSVSTSSPCSTFAGCLSGYAWSPNIGWVSFNKGDLDSAPACTGGSGAAATVDTLNGAVSGFARAVSGIGGTNGWDGCIALSGNNIPAPAGNPFYVDKFSSPDTSGYEGTSTQGISLGINPSNAITYGAFSGYAWENTAIGWLNFYPGFGLGVPPVCIGNCGGGGSAISVSCSPSSESDFFGSGSVIFTATANETGGGSNNYQYSWDNGAHYGILNDASYTYSGTTSYRPILWARDYRNQNIVASAWPACGSVVINTLNPATSLKLMISGGSAAPTAWSTAFPSGYSSATVKKGQPFVLGWDVNLPGDYTCPPSLSSDWPNWGAKVPTPTGSYQSGNSGPLDTSTVKIGQHTFTLDCTSSIGNQEVKSSATLNIVNSSEGEI